MMNPIVLEKANPALSVSQKRGFSPHRDALQKIHTLGRLSPITVKPV